MYEDERTALRVVLLLGVGCFVAAVLVYTPPPPPPPAFEGLLSLREAMARLSAPGPSPLPAQRKSVLVTVYPTPSAQPRNHGSGGADGSRLPLNAPPAVTVGSAPIVSQTSNGLFLSIGER
jgi:hypothetical protein